MKEELLDIHRIFYLRTVAAKEYARPFLDKMKACELYVFGSVARGCPSPSSDVDLMFLIDGNLQDVENAKDIIMCDLSADYEINYPRVDAHACRRDKFYDTTDTGTIFDGFISVIREEGIRIWHRRDSKELNLQS